MVSKSRVFYLSLLFLLLPAVFSQQDIDCNEIPQDGCLMQLCTAVMNLT